MIVELAAAAVGGILAAGTGWFLDWRRQAAKLARTRRMLARAILDDLTYSLTIYDKISEEWEKTKIVWFSTLNELRQSRQPYFNNKDWIVVLDDESLRRDLFRYYLQTTDKINILEYAQNRKYNLERSYNDLTSQIQMKDPTAKVEAVKAEATRIMAAEDKEYKSIFEELPANVGRLVGFKRTAQELIQRLQSAP